MGYRCASPGVPLFMCVCFHSETVHNGSRDPAAPAVMIFGQTPSPRSTRGNRFCHDPLHTNSRAASIIFPGPATAPPERVQVSKGAGACAPAVGVGIQPVGARPSSGVGSARVVDISAGDVGSSMTPRSTVQSPRSTAQPSRILHLPSPHAAGMGSKLKPPTTAAPAQAATPAQAAPVQATPVQATPAAPLTATAGASTGRRPNTSFLDDLLPRRNHLRYGHTESNEPFPNQKKPISNSNVRDLQAAAHVSDGVAANVFNATPAAGRPTAVLREHPSFCGAAGVPSDAVCAQSHPDLPGEGPDCRPAVLPGQRASLQIGQQAEAIIARREALLTPGRPARDLSNYRANTVLPASTFPWEMAEGVSPDRAYVISHSNLWCRRATRAMASHVCALCRVSQGSTKGVCFQERVSARAGEVPRRAQGKHGARGRVLHAARRRAQPVQLPGGAKPPVGRPNLREPSEASHLFLGQADVAHDHGVGREADHAARENQWTSPNAGGASRRMEVRPWPRTASIGPAKLRRAARRREWTYEVHRVHETRPRKTDSRLLRAESECGRGGRESGSGWLGAMR